MLAVFGRPFINNPECVSLSTARKARVKLTFLSCGSLLRSLPKRIFNHWPLNESMGFPNIPKKFYVFVDQPCDGYVSVVLLLRHSAVGK